MSEDDIKTSRCFKRRTSDSDGWVAVNAQRKQRMTKTARLCYTFLLYSQIAIRQCCHKRRKSGKKKKKIPPSSCRGSSSIYNIEPKAMGSCELSISLASAIHAVFHHSEPARVNQGERCNQRQNLPDRESVINSGWLPDKPLMLFSVRCDGVSWFLNKVSRKNSESITGSGSGLIIVTQFICARTETAVARTVLQVFCMVKIQQNNNRECHEF